mgnify:CR=1 FL=1
MNKDELIEFCLINKEAVLTYPFSDEKYEKTPVIRHKTNNKWFALIFVQNGTLFVNLKCNPIDAEILRDNHPYIMPAWHMNKSHWNKVDVNKTPKKLLKKLIEASYNLTK